MDLSVENKVVLTEEQALQLNKQNSRLVSDYTAKKIEQESKKHWDIFYKRNEDRFFKDRHWTVREFKELVSCDGQKVLLEVGCGTGNLIYPLLESELSFFIYACDFSPRAVNIVKTHALYDEKRITAFVADVTKDDILEIVPKVCVNIVTLVFVLSAIHPQNYDHVLKNLYSLIQPGGVILFRDYGLYDMAQLRFKPGHKISENFYMRQDGTRSYFFSIQFVRDLFLRNGYYEICNSYIKRRTINIKEGVDVPRTFVQAKFQKPVLALTS